MFLKQYMSVLMQQLQIVKSGKTLEPNLQHPQVSVLLIQEKVWNSQKTQKFMFLDTWTH